MVMDPHGQPVPSPQTPSNTPPCWSFVTWHFAMGWDIAAGARPFGGLAARRRASTAHGTRVVSRPAEPA